MRLFDDVPRVYKGPALNAEGHFSFLDRSARPTFSQVREVLEEWFSRYPPSSRADLLGRFRSNEDFNHNSAFFELFLHEMFVRLGYGVDVHPELERSTSRPDFLIHSDEGDVYVEAAVVMEETRHGFAAQRRFESVLDELNKLQSPDFYLGLTCEGAPRTSPPMKKIRASLSPWIRQFDPDRVFEEYAAIGSQALPRTVISHGEWWAEILLLPKTEEGRSEDGPTVGFHSGGTRFIRPGRKLRGVLDEKSRHYGRLPSPFVIAANVLEPLAHSNEIVDTLFGNLHSTLVGRSGQVKTERVERLDDGFWRRRSLKPSERISAVMIASPVLPWNVPRARVRIYHNPRSQPEHTSVLPGDGLKRLAGAMSLAELFGLDEAWPGFQDEQDA